MTIKYNLLFSVNFEKKTLYNVNNKIASDFVLFCPLV